MYKGRARDGHESQEREGHLPEYRIYELSPIEWMKVISMGITVAAVIAYIFYRSWRVFGAILIPAWVTVYRFCRDYWKRCRLEQLEIQFKEMIQALSVSLSAGYSVENALKVSQKEMEMMYGRDGMIVKELEYMIRQIETNRSVEAVMDDFALRSSLEEAQDFSYIFSIAKRSGGRLVSIISHTVKIMQDRHMVKEEIRTLTASRRYEQRIMSLMPFLMILYVDVTSPGFFDAMYTTVVGRMVMSVCLLVYVFSCYLSRRILDIKVG